MNVGYVSNVVYPFVMGGAQKRVHEIGTRLVAEGHDVTIYGRHWWDGPATMDHHGMTLRGVAPARELYAGDRRSIREAIDFARHVYRPLRAAVDEHDVVVASVFPYFPVLSAELASLLRGTALVGMWHEVMGEFWDDYLGHLAPFGRAVERATARLPQTPVAVSGHTADRLARLGPPRETIDVVPNGVDVERVRSVDPAPDGYDVLFAGRLIREKHVDVLLSAFDRVAAGRDVTLGIVGEGPELDRLRGAAATLDHADRVSFLGFLPAYDDVLAQMHAASVFAFPSTREGFGITLLEAMAADCTVVAADHPNTPAREVVGEAGVLTDPSVAGVADGLARALDGARPRADPVERSLAFDWDVVAERAERSYRAAVAGTAA